MPKRSEEMLVDLWMSLLLVWITCVPSVSTTPVGGQSRTAQTGGSAAAAASSLGEGQRLLSRAKRGWVWNQMFVLEEFSGRDPILVGRVSVCDCQRYIKLAYRVQTLIRPVWMGPSSSLFRSLPYGWWEGWGCRRREGEGETEIWGRERTGEGRGLYGHNLNYIQAIFSLFFLFFSLCLCMPLKQISSFSHSFCRKNLPSSRFATWRHALQIMHGTGRT